MDRRQRKTKKAIFEAFAELLSQKKLDKITVSEIIDRADVGRATFYAHFETKDLLLKAFCEDLFCHIFDAATGEGHGHQHIFDCSGDAPVFEHLFRHLRENDHHIATLLSSQNNELFFSYFRSGVARLVERHSEMFADKKKDTVPERFWKDYIVSTFVETLRWWIRNGMKENPKVIAGYFLSVV